MYLCILMIRICRHIIYGHIGRIKLELSAGETFPAQYGIYWFDGMNGDQDSIEIIETISESDYQLKYKQPQK